MRVLLFLIGACLAVSSNASADSGHFFSDPQTFAQLVGPASVASFNAFRPGLQPTTLTLGNVTVVLTRAGSAPIFDPLSSPIGFTTNFLSTGVQDGDNNVLIRFPSGTRFATLQIRSVFPITVTATFASGDTETRAFSSTAPTFMGVLDTSGLVELRISSPVRPSLTPIVNIGDVGYGSQLSFTIIDVGSAVRGAATDARAIPTLATPALPILALLVAMMSIRSLAAPARRCSNDVRR
ncbi:MAG: hypothetical protein M3Z31_06310 [Pseudomonadota bacterium]|nr:hypothetical protein [Pseudomonadota bacterium]